MSFSRVIFAMLLLTIFGFGWFYLYEGWSIIDSAYMTIITLSTVGFREVRPLTDASKVFVCVFLVSGLGVFLYGAVQVGESVVRGQLGDWWRKRNMGEAINALSGHFIICGTGRMGRLLAEDLAARALPFVVVDSDEAVVDGCRERGWMSLCADATADSTLDEAGIDRAAGLAATLSSDADNLFVVMSSRMACADIRIVARAHDDASARKLERAGANRVVSPYESGAVKMGQLLTNPRLNDFFEIVSGSTVGFDLAGIPVPKESKLVGKRLAESGIRRQGLMIVAVRHANGEVLLAPDGETQIRAGDELYALGTTDAIDNLGD